MHFRDMVCIILPNGVETGQTVSGTWRFFAVVSCAFSALTLLVGWYEGHPACKKTEWWGAGVVICLERYADLHMPSWCHCHSLSLASVKSRLVLPFWYRPTRIVLDKGPLNGCVCVCMCDLNHSTSHPAEEAEEKSSLKGAWSGSNNPF